MTKVFDIDKVKKKVFDLEKLDDLDDYEGFWVNLAFLKGGISKMGSCGFDSKEAAEKQYEKAMNNTSPYVKLSDGMYHKSDISYAIQMPIG